MFNLKKSLLKLSKQKFFPYLLVILLSLPAFYFFFKPGIYWNMHDDMQMIRQLEFEKCLFDGQIPCRWTPDLGFGYGYPLFNFYPPLPYIVGQVFRVLGFSFMATVKLTAVLQFILAACFMYLLVSSIFGPLGGVISALFYTYAPYHALNIYVRGAMNEAWASVFFPLTLYFSRKLILEKQKTKYIVGLAVSFSCILLSHNPMALTFAPILLLWCSFWLFSLFKKKNSFWQNIKNQFPLILKLASSAIISLGLSAFFTLPVLMETKYVSVETMFSGYYHFSAHFVSLYQMFISNFWGDGGSIWGPNDSMSFMIGYLHWILPLLILIFSSFYFLKTKKIDKKIFLSVIFVFIGFFAAFMTHERSTQLWFFLPIIQKIQFPWRFLNHSTFAFSLSVGIVPFLISKFIRSQKIIRCLITFLIVILFAVNLQYFYPMHSGPITDEEKFSGLNWERQITSGIYDYLPKTAAKAAISASREYVDEINPEEALVNLSGQKKGTDWLFFSISLNQDTQITISQLAFPNFKITDNGQEIDYQIDPEFGRMMINLTSGQHQIFINLENTPIRTVSDYISLLVWSGLFIYLLKPLWIRLIFRK